MVHEAASKIPVAGQVEALSLIGGVAMDKNEHKARAHVVAGRRDGATRVGRLIEGVVLLTREIMTADEMRKKFGPESALALISL